MVCPFCSPETQHFQKNNIFSLFSPKNLEIHDAKVVGLLEFIGIINEMQLISWSKKLVYFGSTTLIADFEIFWLKNEKILFFGKCWVSGRNFLPKNDLTTVFVAQSTDLPIKNGVIEMTDSTPNFYSTAVVFPTGSTERSNTAPEFSGTEIDASSGMVVRLSELP